MNERQVSMGSSWVNIVLGIFVVILAVCARYSFYQGAVEQYRHGSCGRCSCHHPLEKASTGWSWPNLILEYGLLFHHSYFLPADLRCGITLSRESSFPLLP